ncbi:hypothetical protein ACFLXG_03085 [Chloroflexota bacterium]
MGMKPDLKSFSITEINIRGDIALTTNLIDAIGKASPPDEDGDSDFRDSYKVGRSSYVAWGFLSVSSKDDMPSWFGLRYEEGRGGKLGKSIPRINEAIEILSAIDDPTELYSLVKFEFRKRDRIKAILNLPVTLSESPSMPFNEIRGIHFSKLEGKHSKYDVILDYSQGGSLSETVIFELKAKINESLIDECIKEAISISNRFVMKEK